MGGEFQTIFFFFRINENEVTIKFRTLCYSWLLPFHQYFVFNPQLHSNWFLIHDSLIWIRLHLIFVFRNFDNTHFDVLTLASTHIHTHTNTSNYGYECNLIHSIQVSSFKYHSTIFISPKCRITSLNMQRRGNENICKTYEIKISWKNREKWMQN